MTDKIIKSGSGWVIIRMEDWRGIERDIEFIKDDSGNYNCSNCDLGECNGCITGSDDPCACNHEEESE